MRWIRSLTLGLLAVSCAGCGTQPLSVHPTASANQPLNTTQAAATVYELRKFPYPYRGALAISSDADHQTLRKFNLIHQFLNTTTMTPWGPGVGLDIADSMFLYNGSDLRKRIDIRGTPVKRELSYFAGTTPQRYAADILDRYIHAGWIDTLHSYGDFTRQNQSQTLFERSLARTALDQLQANGSHLTVWTDHGNKSNVDNFGSYGRSPFYDYQLGATPQSPYYHTDLLIPYGVRFVWTDQNSDVFGHSSVIYPLRLPDGRMVWGFWRYTSTGYSRRHGTEWLWTVDKLSRELSPAHLAELTRNGQYAIVAQHLSADNEQHPLPKNGVDTLRSLAVEYQHGRLLVARTSRLLQYNVSHQYARFNTTFDADGFTTIHIQSIDDPVFGVHQPSLSEVRGLTFYTSAPAKTRIAIGDTLVENALLQRNPGDGFSPSIGIKWYPDDTTNYAINSTQNPPIA